MLVGLIYGKSGQRAEPRFLNLRGLSADRRFAIFAGRQGLARLAGRNGLKVSVEGLLYVFELPIKS